MFTLCVKRGALLIAAYLVLAQWSAYAQIGKASLNGTVTDSSGAVVPGSQIVATNTGTGDRRETTSVDNGTYVFPLLPVGNYSVTCSRAGFKTTVTPIVKLDADAKVAINCTLEVGNATQHVEVTAAADQLNTTNGTLGGLIPETVVEELPLNGRNPGEMVSLVAGAIDAFKTGSITRGDFVEFPNSTESSVSASRKGEVYYQLDGANNNDYNGGYANPFPNPDATQEFNVATNNFDTQGGFTPGAVVSVVTRSGTNTWHGGLYEFLRNDVFNARDFFSHERDSLKRNQFGGSIGGKIIADKLFIFGNYQGTTENRVSGGQEFYVPNNQQLAGDFSGLLGTTYAPNPCGTGGPANLNFLSGQIFDPQTATYYTCPAGSRNAGTQIVVQQPFPGNIITPASRLSPIALKIVNSTLPQTNNPNDIVNEAGGVTHQTYNEFTIRSDWNPSGRNRVSGKVFFDDFSLPAEGGGGDDLLSTRSWIVRYRNYSAEWTYTIRPNLLNYFVFGYNNMYSTSDPGMRTKSGGPACYSCFGVNVAEPLDVFPAGLEDLEVSGMSWNGQNTNRGPRQTYTINETITWNHGEHLIVAGVNVLHPDVEITDDWLSLPLISFNGQFTGNGVADFLLGDASSFEQGGGERPTAHGTQWGAFVQDTIHLKPSLTLGVGVRWEPFFPYTLLDEEVPAFRLGQHSTRYPNAPIDMLFAGDPGVGSAGAPADTWVFDPRVSIAWAPKALPHTSIRAAFGMFADPWTPNYSGHAVDSPPFSPVFTITPTTTGGPVVPGGTPIPFADPWSVYTYTNGQSPFPPFAPTNPPSTASFILPVTILTSFDQNVREGRNQAWNLSVEHQFAGNILARVAYVGSEAYHLPVPWEWNPGIYSTNPNLNGQRTRFPQFGNIEQIESWGTESYDALQLTFDKRFSRGLQFTANYTWSKAIDSNSAANLGDVSPLGDPFDMHWNRGLSNNNFPHVLNTFGVYRIPTFASHGRLFSGILGSWELSGIWHAQSGSGLTITGGRDASQSHIGGDRADLTGQPFNVRQGPKSQWVNQYFNTSAFVVNAAGTFGNSARNAIEGPGINNVDFAFIKNFPFHERYHIQFRWEMFNALNRTEFGNPNTNVASGATFGTITSTRGGSGSWEQQYEGFTPREMQAALKFYW